MADFATFNLKVLAAEGTEATEPNATLTFTRTDGTAAATAVHVVFPPARSFKLPAFPTENALFCDVGMSLYRPQKSQFFFPRADEPQNCSMVAMRDPGAWSPGFQGLADLPSLRFDPLRELLKVSDGVDLKHGPQIGNLLEQYDNLSNPDNQQAVLAKMCLLNLYAVISDERDPKDNQPWFRFVNKILRIDRERFVAEIDPKLADLVAEILQNLDAFSKQGFFTESPAQHFDNIPEGYVVDKLITVKKRYEQGNLQLTIALTQHNGQSVPLLDCDLDENSNIIVHTSDLFKHVFTGGTHPVDMHEYIQHHSANLSADGISKLELGYTLQPAS
jgi:hypothetical protein